MSVTNTAIILTPTDLWIGFIGFITIICFIFSLAIHIGDDNGSGTKN